MSSNVNEIIRAVLNSFFYKKILHAPKAQKHKDATKQKHKTLQAKKKKNALKKHLRGKKSLIRLFAFLVFCAFCAREEKKIEKREKSPQCKCTKYQCPYN